MNAMSITPAYNKVFILKCAVPYFDLRMGIF